MHLKSLPSFARFSLAAVCLALPVIACSSSSSGTPGNTADSGTNSADTGTKGDGGTNTPTDGGTVTDTGTATDTGTVTASDSSSPEDSAIVDTGTIMGTDASTSSFAGTYQCMLQGMANVSGLGMQSLPFDGTMTVTVNGSALTAVLTADGGTDCTLDFTATSATNAEVNANQMCVVTAMGVMATLTFISPTGTAMLSGNTITANMPFNLSALSGAVTGTGTLMGPCTKM